MNNTRDTGVDVYPANVTGVGTVSVVLLEDHVEAFVKLESEVERLRAEVKRLQDAAELAARVGAPNFHAKNREIRILSAQRDSACDRADKLQAQLAERDALLIELAEAAEVFSCSAHCESSEAGDALELLNTILARVNALKAPKCRVCGKKLHADGYCSFRDCGVPGKGTKALSATSWKE